MICNVCHSTPVIRALAVFVSPGCRCMPRHYRYNASTFERVSKQFGGHFHHGLVLVATYSIHHIAAHIHAHSHTRLLPTTRRAVSPCFLSLLDKSHSHSRVSHAGVNCPTIEHSPSRHTAGIPAATYIVYVHDFLPLLGLDCCPRQLGPSVLFTFNLPRSP